MALYAIMRSVCAAAFGQPELEGVLDAQSSPRGMLGDEIALRSELAVSASARVGHEASEAGDISVDAYVATTDMRAMEMSRRHIF
jgi:hypothetical protein